MVAPSERRSNSETQPGGVPPEPQAAKLWVVRLAITRSSCCSFPNPRQISLGRRHMVIRPFVSQFASVSSVMT